MNIAQIRYFVTAAQFQNLSKAAEALHLSQPALSKSIAKLEEDLGTPLFVRKGKRIILNQQGQRFLESAWVILRNLDNALVELDALTAGAAARVSVGLCGPDEKISRCLADYASLHPEAGLDLNCSIDTDEQLDINQYDMVLYPDVSRYSRFRGIPLWEDPYLLALPAGHPLSAKASILPRELEGMPFVFLSRDQQYIEEPYYLCTGLNLRLRALYFTDSRTQHQQLIAAGLALGFVSAGCAGPYRQDPQICLLPISSSKFSRKLALCFKRDKHLSPAGKALRAFMLDRLGLHETGQRENTV